MNNTAQKITSGKFVFNWDKSLSQLLAKYCKLRDLRKLYREVRIFNKQLALTGLSKRCGPFKT